MSESTKRSKIKYSNGFANQRKGKNMKKEMKKQVNYTLTITKRMKKIHIDQSKAKALLLQGNFTKIA